MYSYIYIMYAFTYSFIHIIYAYIHILSYSCFYCQMLLYGISYYLLHHAFTMPIIHVHILIPMLCHLLFLSIVLIIYVFLSCVPSMFHLIPFGMSIIDSYHLLYYTCHFSYTFHLLLCSCSCSYFSSFSCFISYSCFLVPL